MPFDISGAISRHDVGREQTRGWAGTKNGALLRRAKEAGFDVLVTVDRNLEYQQNIGASGLALVVLRARSTRVADLLPTLAPLLRVLPGVEAGTTTHVHDGDV